MSKQRRVGWAKAYFSVFFRSFLRTVTEQNMLLFRIKKRRIRWEK